MAVMHNHLGPGWQDMSSDDVVMEQRKASLIQPELQDYRLLDDPEYIQSQPMHQRPNTANVFPASLMASSQQLGLFTRLILGPTWWPPVYQQRFHLSVASQHAETEVCRAYCDVHARSSQGNLGEPAWLLLNTKAC